MNASNESQTPDTKPGPYYVSAVMGKVLHLMAGPYVHHQEALDLVDKVRTIATDKDTSGRAIWMSWGTVRVEGCEKIGQLQKFGLLAASH